jgi:signal transduction histidine kinase
VTSLLGVPIVARGHLLGALYLADKIGEDGFTERDEELIQTLTAHTAVAIENAHFYERVRRQAVLDERARIGMDLHDGIIQSIYAVGLSLELGRMVVKEDATETEGHITSAIEGLDNIIRDIRSYIMDLQPARIEGEPLGIALDRLVREFRANTLVQVDLDVASDIEDGLADNCCLALFHITQEALANVAKHARASTVKVKLDRLHSWVVLNVEDDGVGFDSDNIGGIPGHGLSNMAVRTHSLGGNLTVNSAPGDGTSVQAVIPIHAPINVPPRLVSFP